MPPTLKKPNLTDKERDAIVQYLLTQYDLNNKCNHLVNGAINGAARKFKVHRASISKIWSKACLSFENGDVPVDVRSKKRVNVQPKRLNRSEITEKVKRVPFWQRQTLRSLAAATF